MRTRKFAFEIHWPLAEPVFCNEELSSKTKAWSSVLGWKLFTIAVQKSFFHRFTFQEMPVVKPWKIVDIKQDISRKPR